VHLESDALGLEDGTVRVVPYDLRWPGLFVAASQELGRALGLAALAIHHAGSTAVPGLCAKPILDVLVSIADFDAAPAMAPLIESLGYEFRPDEDIRDRHFFRRRRGTARTHHLSLAESSSRYHRATLAFRDALRADSVKAQAYAELKLDLARRYPRDRPAYIEGKTGFIERVLEEAGLTQRPGAS
jgi:GrpB-like predicted nucleotidyltransferase (UPF0157 family)